MKAPQMSREPRNAIQTQAAPSSGHLVGTLVQLLQRCAAVEESTWEAPTLNQVIRDAFACSVMVVSSDTEAPLTRGRIDAGAPPSCRGFCVCTNMIDTGLA